MADDDVIDGIAEVLPKTLESTLDMTYYFESNVAKSFKPRFIKKVSEKS